MSVLPVAADLASAPSPAPRASRGQVAPDLKPITALIARGDLASAERQLRPLLAAGAGPRVRALLGAVLLREGRIDAAAGELGRALADDPALGGARQDLARIELARGREADAL